MILLDNNPTVVHYPQNTQGRDFVVGDLHGCIHMLKPLLLEMQFDETKDRLYSVGDLVDRGLFSEQTLNLLREAWFFAVLGNHEDLARDAMAAWLKSQGEWDGPALDWNRVEAQAISHVHNGGAWLVSLLASKHLSKEAKVEYCREMIDRINKMPLVITVGEGGDRFNVVHSEISLFGEPASDKLLDEDPDRFVRDDFIWARNFFAYARSQVKANPFNYQDGLSLTYSGHTPVLRPTKIARQINIDTCAFYADFISKERNQGQGLTIVEPLNFNFWHIDGATKEITHDNLTNPGLSNPFHIGDII